MDIFLLWWFAQANVIVGVISAVVAASVAGVILGGIAWAVAQDENIVGWESTCRGLCKGSIAAFLIAAILLIAIPGRTGLAIIVGGKLSLDAIQSEEVTETAGKLYELVNRELDNRLQETEPEESE